MVYVAGQAAWGVRDHALVVAAAGRPARDLLFHGRQGLAEVGRPAASGPDVHVLPGSAAGGQDP